MNRLLCLISGMDAGGAETFLMKVYRRLDKTMYQMDFCINVSQKCFYEDEIIALGGKIYRIPSKSQNAIAFSQQLTNIIRKNGYKYVLRITSNAMGFWDLKIAKNAGADVCIARSSNSSDGGTWKSRMAHKLGQLLFIRYIDVKFAPSDLAAQYTFGRDAYEKGNVTILPNAVDLGVFQYDESARDRIRKELGIEKEALLVGHVGRFDIQKNHTFLLEIFKEIVKKQPKSRLLLVGKGTLEQQIRQRVQEMNLQENVLFVGVRSDIPQILSAMDVFVFPSFYEGMPNTVIEAQATGLPCIIADTITREANITGLVQYLSLADAPETWAETALEAAKAPRKNTKQDFIDNHYDIQSTVDEFIQLCFRE